MCLHAPARAGLLSADITAIYKRRSWAEVMAGRLLSAPAPCCSSSHQQGSRAAPHSVTSGKSWTWNPALWGPPSMLCSLKKVQFLHTIQQLSATTFRIQRLTVLAHSFPSAYSF